MRVRILFLTLTILTGAAFGSCKLEVRKATVRYYDDKPGQVAVEGSFYFLAKNSNPFSECSVYSATDTQRAVRYPLFRVEGPARLSEQMWGMPRQQAFAFQAQPVDVVGPGFQFRNTLVFLADAKERRGELKMTIRYQFVDDHGISQPEELQMLLPYDLDSPRSKKYGPERLTAKEIIFMPITIPLNIIKLVVCGLECDPISVK